MKWFCAPSQIIGRGALLLALSLVTPVSALPPVAGAATSDVPVLTQAADAQFRVSDHVLSVNVSSMPQAYRIDPAFSGAAFEVWLAAAPSRSAAFDQFEAYLREVRIDGVVPHFQLWRTASLFRQCGAEAFAIPERKFWRNIVGVLGFVRDHIKPAIGGVEVVSAYRPETLNKCAGGARRSTHRFYQALDLMPLQPMIRTRLVTIVCQLHTDYGKTADIGLGFYDGVRFHLDENGYRRWGANGHSETSPCGAVDR